MKLDIICANCSASLGSILKVTPTDDMRFEITPCEKCSAAADAQANEDADTIDRLLAQLRDIQRLTKEGLEEQATKADTGIPTAKKTGEEKIGTGI